MTVAVLPGLLAVIAAYNALVHPRVQIELPPQTSAGADVRTEPWRLAEPCATGRATRHLRRTSSRGVPSGK